MPGPCADVREAERLQDLADCALVVVDAEAFEDELLQIDTPPPNDAVDGAVGAGLDDLGEFDQLRLRQPGWVPLRADVGQPVGTLFVEAVDPIAQGLAIHATDPGRLLAVHPVEHGCQRQQPSALVGMLRRGSEPPQVGSRVVRSKLHRSSHGANPPHAMESAIQVAGKPPRVSLGARWYNAEHTAVPPT